jgi:hypothetical protein
MVSGRHNDRPKGGVREIGLSLFEKYFTQRVVLYISINALQSAERTWVMFTWDESPDHFITF